jgi:hypothetical protein
MCPCYTVRSESRCALRVRYVDLVVSTEVAVEVLVDNKSERLSERRSAESVYE